MDTTKPLIIYGAASFASLAAHTLIHDNNRRLAAFTVDTGYVKNGTHDGYPLVAFDEVAEKFPPDAHEMLLPLGYKGMNALRADRLAQAKEMGYSISKLVSRHSCVAHGIHIGENVFIYEHAIVQAYAQLGFNVTIRAGANIGHHTRVGNHTFIASSVATGGNVTIGERCFIGLGAVLRDGVRIGDRCFIGAGAVVVSDTEPDSVYVGNPARKLAKSSFEAAS